VVKRGERDSRTARILKWVGAATAVISLLLGGRQLFTIAADYSRRAREASELVEIARQQASRGEFAAAWRSLDDAEALRGGDSTQAARLEVGFRWLQEGRPGPGQPFSRITDAVVPVLDRVLRDSDHPRRADALAHLGWATFLRRRETGTGNPRGQYEQALAADPANVYAHTFLGHWIMWERGPVTEARRHFEAALAAGRERPFVRRFQLAALVNRNDDEADAGLLRVANEMRKGGEPIEGGPARAARAAFLRRYGPHPTAPPLADVPADDLRATYTWLEAPAPR
jgi:hypothetical protein